MSFPHYTEYRGSGVEWLGDVPNHWEAKPIKRIVLFSNAGEVIDRSYWGGDSELLYTCAIDPLQCDYSGFPEAKRTSSRDLLVTRNGTPYVHKPEPGSIYTNVVQRIRLKSEASRDFVALALQNSANNLKGYGVSIESLNYEMWRELVVPLPSLDEQAAIVSFLDHETAKIDALVAEQEKLIALLKEKRQAVISHAVTKGLNPDAPMKDSGIEWLGEVPAHWEVTPLKWLTDPERPIMYGIVLPGPDVGEGIPILKGGNVKPSRMNLQAMARTTPEIEAPYARARLKTGDLVYSIRGTIGDCEPVPVELEGSNITQDVARIAIASGVNSDWARWALLASAIRDDLACGSLGAAVRGINIFDLKRAKIPTPSPSEQLAVAMFIERETKTLERLSVEAQSAIDLLKERRSALISAAVTGKIDVRGLASAKEAA